MIRVVKKDRIINATVSLTPSKSITNRALIIRALSDKNYEIENRADADDSSILDDVLKTLPETIDVKDAGTVFRFLTAFLSVRDGEFHLTGTDRMFKRPVGGLVKALRSIGAEIEFAGEENFPPLHIRGSKLRGGSIRIDASESSQFVSALLMIAPTLTEGLNIELSGKIYSEPYISMTLSLMEYFGIKSSMEGNIIHVAHQDYISKNLIVENDWSAASFWYLMTALSVKSEIILKGLSKKSIQGDALVDEMMKRFGVESKTAGSDLLIYKTDNVQLPDYFEYDFSGCPDLVIPLAVLCSALKIKSHFSGVKNLRIKESDRSLALKSELGKTGAEIILEEDSFTMNSFSENKNKEIFHSHSDHRIVMSLAALSMIDKEVIIDDHLPVSKSYPGFWDDLVKAGFVCEYF